MSLIRTNRFSVIVIGAIALVVMLFTECMQEPKLIRDFKGNAFVGSSSCQSCHANIFATHLHTAHSKTSAYSSIETIHGSFNPDSNSFFFDQHRQVRMDSADGKLWQTALVDGKMTRRESIDLVIGSGQSGQTFASWKNDRLFQLPISFFAAANRWSNSPGYSDTVYYDRAVSPRCLECHSTYVKVKQIAGEDTQSFDSTQMILGITCEKCHGPGQKHVAFQTEHAGGKDSTLIINPARFTREQSLDLCGSCHGGQILPTTSAFRFAAGDTLKHFFIVNDSKPDPSAIDVHGNQLGLLKSSKCFLMSGTMTCNTCHNPHADERGQLAAFSAKCQGCHNAGHGPVCPELKLQGESIKDNCIDCHMPKKPSQTITMLMGKGQKAAATIRSHYIAIYPDTLQHITQR